MICWTLWFKAGQDFKASVDIYTYIYIYIRDLMRDPVIAADGHTRMRPQSVVLTGSAIFFVFLSK